MCGICGIVRFDNSPVQETPLHLMMRKMKHRGPDDEGIFIENNVGLGFVRLSIIDLSPAGHQPMVSWDGRYIIVFNGEIYNYLELKKELNSLGYSFRTHTDTEVLLYSFIHWGEECLHHLNGMWAFVIYDRIKNEIFGCRDRFGVKPFYYLITSNQLVFASDISAILKVLNDKPKPNEAIIFDYLVFNRTDQNENTFFCDVKKLQHGHSFRLSLSDSRFVINKWYDLRSSLKKPFSSPLEFRDQFSSSIGLRLRSDVPVGVCLSGGLDSSAIVSTLLKDYSKNDVHTFSAIYGKGITGDESGFINEYRKSVQNMHFVTPSAESLLNDIEGFVTAHSEPIPTSSPYAQYKVMELARRNVVVTLDGQGADEQLGGYHYFFGFFLKDLALSMKWLKFIAEAVSYYKNHKSFYGLKSMTYFMLPQNLQSKIKVINNGYLNHRYIKKHEKGNSIASSIYSSGSLHEALLDHFEYKLEHLLKWEDKNSMWFSIEARVPFLDYRLVEQTLSLDPEKIIKDGMNKYILREAMNGTLPESIRLRRDKIGFSTPAGDWFRHKSFQVYIKELINSESFRSRDIFNNGKVDTLYSRFLNGKSDISGEIWKWIHLETWYRQFID